MSLELLRVEFRIVGLTRDENGVIVSERLLGEGIAHPAGLDQMPQSIRDAVVEAARAGSEGEA